MRVCNMPATVGGGRMPHNNRMGTSRTLETNNIWSKTIGHDPYANPEKRSTYSVQEMHDGGESEEFKNLSRLIAKKKTSEVTDAAYTGVSVCGSVGEQSGWRGKKPLKGMFSAGPMALAGTVEESSSDSESEEDRDSDHGPGASVSEQVTLTDRAEKKRLKKVKKREKKERKKQKKKERKEKKKGKKQREKQLIHGTDDKLDLKRKRVDGDGDGDGDGKKKRVTDTAAE